MHKEATANVEPFRGERAETEMPRDDGTNRRLIGDDTMRKEDRVERYTEDSAAKEVFTKDMEAPTGRPTEKSEHKQMRMKEVAYQQGEATQAILSHFQRGQLPKAEIPVFNGDVTKYRSFIRAFDSRVSSKTEDDEERLYFLEQYTSGKPRDVIRGCMNMSVGSGYLEARRMLERRYGDEDAITSAFVDMIMDWPQVKPGDTDGLDRFSLTLTSCNNVMNGIDPGARETDHPKTMRRVIDKLPYPMQDQWRRRADQIRERENRRAKFDDIVSFVEKEVRIQTNPTFGRQQRNTKSKEFEGQGRKVSAAVRIGDGPGRDASVPIRHADVEQSRAPPKCWYCSKRHYLEHCEELRGKAPHEKNAFIKEKGLCFGCLGKGHMAKECARRKTCSVCKLKHPTVLHNGRPPPVPEAEAVTGVKENSSQVVLNGRVQLGRSQRSGADSPSTMMSIVPVRIWLEDGRRAVETYAFLDGGSSATFCSESLLRRIGVQGEKVTLSMTTASVDNQRLDSCVVRGLKISDLDGDTEIAMPPTYALGSIPVRLEDMASKEDLDQWVHLQDIELPRIDAEIGLLIGSNCPRALQPMKVRRSEDGGPFAIQTELGWVVQGPRRSSRTPDGRVKVNRIQAVQNNSDIHDCFVALYNQDFEHDNSVTDVGLSMEDRAWLKIVKGGIRHAEGHYEIPMPLKSETPLPDNRAQAEKRAEHLKRRMMRDDKYLQDYKKFVNELIEKNYAEQVKYAGARGERSWYIPHHGVYHATKPEKIRVVYDCSAVYRGISLNSLLLQGPNLTSSLVGVLLRFREKPIAVMADIEKMFYQVRVPVEDRSLLRFLWWPNGDTEKDLEEYQMNVHLFGAVSSPACANFALRRTAQDFGDMFDDDVKDSIQRSFYVDDFMRTGSTPEEVLRVARGVRGCCALGGFRLTGFVSNSTDVMLGLPETESVAQRKLDLTGYDQSTQTQKALGVQWDVSEDTLSFRVDVGKGAATRRGLLSTVSAVYDPLGFGAPFIMPAKILLQDLCRLKLGWDEAVPDAHERRWSQWCEELNDLREFCVPRSVTAQGQILSCQLHLFADASESGYGAVAYIRVIDDTETVRTSLLMSKSRVAPLKTTSIPRLELASAALAVQLSTQILSELDLKVDEVHFWTDSVSTLRYIHNTTSRFQTFVANRLSIIHDGSKPDQWKYVPSAQNPADALSRGQSAREFLHSSWTSGPAFLGASTDEWPEQTYVAQSTDDVEDLEVKRSLVSATAAERDCTLELLSSTSDWHKLKKRVAWWLRMKCILRQRLVSRKGGDAGTDTSEDLRLTVQELDAAEAAIVRYTQEKSFSDEMTSGSVKKSSPLRRLNPCLIDGTLRVGGRLSEAAIPAAAKHQLILPKNGHITDLIIRDTHERLGHQGREHVLSVLRSVYWIVDGNAAVRRVLSKCVSCRKRQAAAVTQVMSDLPRERITPDEPPFTRVGTDYFGPFYTKNGRKQFKRYGVLFTCLTTRAVHIEIADSLDTSSFICALRRFQARRGQVKYIRSDNGTNFVGAERELRAEVEHLNKNKIHESLSEKGITWVFNAPGASHHGGVWERQIRTVRKILGALLREQTLSDESLRTLMCEVEAVINSRPLTTVSSDPTDLEPLTPNHLLLLRGGPAPSGVFDKDDNYPRRRWRQVQYLADLFWTRWLREYLPLLQPRERWTREKRNLRSGDVVLIMDLSLPRAQWPLGRIVEVFPDRRGFVRSVQVRTGRSVLKRPISKLVLVQESESPCPQPLAAP